MALRRTIASIALLALLAAGIGVPVPRLQFKGAGNYRCRGHACGCLTELMCRTRCCCFKPKSSAGCHKCVKKTAQCAIPQRRSRRSSLVLVIHSLDCKGDASVWCGVRNVVPFRIDASDARPRAKTGRVRPGALAMNSLASVDPDSPPPKRA